MYQLLFQDKAIQDLADIDKETARRIVARLHWLAQNIASIKCESLTGELSEFYKFRVGDYRILYQVSENKQAIVINRIGHRSQIYRGK
jgi:mRNA interferase RelE/StbE